MEIKGKNIRIQNMNREETRQDNIQIIKTENMNPKLKENMLKLYLKDINFSPIRDGSKFVGFSLMHKGKRVFKKIYN